MILRHLTLNGNAKIQFGSSKYEKRQDCKVGSDWSRRVFLVYVGSIVWFDVRLGYNQPQGSVAIVIATFSDGNEGHERVLRLEKIDGRNYIAANRWPRAWYNHAITNPNV
tara:strand:+ start:498 stop:827 length:330 start_codon:yes stop_codon:yes gene_type:complete